MNVDTVCTLLINALKDAGYNDSTIFNYQGAVRRFKAFCKEHDVTEYSFKIGKLYAYDVIRILSGCKSDVGSKVLGRSKPFEIADLCKHSQSGHRLDSDEAGQLMDILLISFI